jgi:septal ring-binding cell division protein DamX
VEPFNEPEPAVAEDAAPGSGMQAAVEPRLQNPVPSPQALTQRDESWLRSQNPSHLTLQLLTAKQLATLQRFVKKHGLHGDLVYVRSVYQGVKRYNLIYGIYPEPGPAKETANRLKAALRLEPWLRSVGSVQAQMVKGVMTSSPGEDDN